MTKYLTMSHSWEGLVYKSSSLTVENKLVVENKQCLLVMRSDLIQTRAPHGQASGLQQRGLKGCCLYSLV